MFPNDPGDWGSIPGRVIPKTQKMVLDAALLNTQHYKVRIKVKWGNPRNGVVPFPTPQYRSYWKGSLRVTLNYVCQLYLYASFKKLDGWFGWGCRIHWLHLSRGVRLLQQVYWIWHWWWGSSNAGALRNVKYFFIAFTPRLQSGSEW